MQSFILTIKVKNLRAAEKNPIKFNYFPLPTVVYIMQEKLLKVKKIKCVFLSTFIIHFRVKLIVLYNTKDFQQYIINMIPAAILSQF